MEITEQEFGRIHYHVAFLLDGHAIMSAYGFRNNLECAWRDSLDDHITPEQLVHMNPPRYTRNTSNGILLDHRDDDYNDTCNHAAYQLSYLAKLCRKPDYVHKTFGCSMYTKHA